ncbi:MULTISPECIES: hypothetical protein [unclassified Microcoleus]|uniref:hypothetical protein n=1 Tax=unclassified Microcoleus TaxID=2642155 RepID=UPI002FD40574
MPLTFWGRAREEGRSVLEIDALSLKIPLLLKALYFKGIASIRKMLATQKDLCCLIQSTSILSRDPRINNWLTSFFINSESLSSDCRPIENSNQRCNQHGSELNSLVHQREKDYLADRIDRLTHEDNRALTERINQTVKTAVHHWEVHPINNIVFGCYRGLQKFAPAPKANPQKLLQMHQAAKSSTFTAERGNQGALMTPLKIKFFAVFSEKISLEVSPFLSGGGVSKHQ